MNRQLRIIGLSFLIAVTGATSSCIPRGGVHSFDVMPEIPLGTPEEEGESVCENGLRVQRYPLNVGSDLSIRGYGFIRPTESELLIIYPDGDVSPHTVNVENNNPYELYLNSSLVVEIGTAGVVYVKEKGAMCGPSVNVGTDLTGL